VLRGGYLSLFVHVQGGIPQDWIEDEKFLEKV
jgi:hypothetical protein